MKRIVACFLVLSGLAASAFVSMPSHPAVPQQQETPDPFATKAPESVNDGFTGNWIAYNVIPLKPGSSSGLQPGIRLKITPESYSDNSNVCSDPKYSIKTITKNEFFNGNTMPKSSIELYGDEFAYLSSGCSGVEPSGVILVYSGSLAGMVKDDLILFEPDSEATINGIDVTTDLVTGSNVKPPYEIHGQVPVVQLDSAVKLNALLKKTVDDELEGFKKDMKTWEIPPEMADQASFKWIRYDAALVTPELASIRFHVDYYNAGAAHPNHYFIVVNYDLKNDRPVEFKDLFKDRSKALMVLSQASKTALDKPDFPLFEEGLQQKEENFKNWNLTEDGLRLSYDPYQVAPYAAGPQEVLVPFSEIKGLVNPAGSFGVFIAQH